MAFVRQGDPIGAFLEIESSPKVIGRAESCALRINDLTVSRIHCCVWFDGTSCWVEDLRSTNGTLLNRRPVRIARIGHGDEISLGASRLALMDLREAARAVARLARPPSRLLSS